MQSLRILSFIPGASYIKNKIKLFILKTGNPRVLRVKINGKQLYLSNTVAISDIDKIEFGDNIFINHQSVLDGFNGIKIGSYCQICVNVGIYTHSSHNSIRLYGDSYFEIPFNNHLGRIKGSVEIGPFCFVGPNSLIMPNTKIGKGCIITAYSYVKGDFPDYSIIGGNPAKVIGDTREQDKKLLEKHPELKEYYYEKEKI